MQNFAPEYSGSFYTPFSQPPQPSSAYDGGNYAEEQAFGTAYREDSEEMVSDSLDAYYSRSPDKPPSYAANIGAPPPPPPPPPDQDAFHGQTPASGATHYPYFDKNIDSQGGYGGYSYMGANEGESGYDLNNSYGRPHQTNYSQRQTANEPIGNSVRRSRESSQAEQHFKNPSMPRYGGMDPSAPPLPNEPPPPAPPPPPPPPSATLASALVSRPMGRDRVAKVHPLKSGTQTRPGRYSAYLQHISEYDQHSENTGISERKQPDLNAMRENDPSFDNFQPPSFQENYADYDGPNEHQDFSNPVRFTRGGMQHNRDSWNYGRISGNISEQQSHDAEEESFDFPNHFDQSDEFVTYSYHNEDGGDSGGSRPSFGNHPPDVAQPNTSAGYGEFKPVDPPEIGSLDPKPLMSVSLSRPVADQYSSSGYGNYVHVKDVSKTGPSFQKNDSSSVSVGGGGGPSFAGLVMKDGMLIADSSKPKTSTPSKTVPAPPPTGQAAPPVSSSNATETPVGDLVLSRRKQRELEHANPEVALLDTSATFQHCDLCNIDFESEKDYNRHSRGVIHTQRLLAKENTAGMVDIKAPDPSSSDSGVDGVPGKGKKMKLVTRLDDLLSNPILSIQTYIGKGKNRQQVFQYFCKVCESCCSSPEGLQAHIDGKRHKKMLRNRVMLAKMQRVLRGDKVKSIDTNNRALCQDQIEASADPVIGADHVVEYVSELQTDCEARYICSLCDTKCDPRTIFIHLTSHKHRFTYFKEVRSEYFADLVHLRDDKAAATQLTSEYAREVHRQSGCGLVKQKMEAFEVEIDEDDNDETATKKLVADLPTPGQFRQAVRPNFSSDVSIAGGAGRGDPFKFMSDNEGWAGTSSGSIKGLTIESKKPTFGIIGSFRESVKPGTDKADGRDQSMNVDGDLTKNLAITGDDGNQSRGRGVSAAGRGRGRGRGTDETDNHVSFDSTFSNRGGRGSSRGGRGGRGGASAEYATAANRQPLVNVRTFGQQKSFLGFGNTSEMDENVTVVAENPSVAAESKEVDAENETGNSAGTQPSGTGSGSGTKKLSVLQMFASAQPKSFDSPGSAAHGDTPSKSAEDEPSPQQQKSGSTVVAGRLGPPKSLFSGPSERLLLPGGKAVNRGAAAEKARENLASIKAIASGSQQNFKDNFKETDSLDKNVGTGNVPNQPAVASKRRGAGGLLGACPVSSTGPESETQSSNSTPSGTKNFAYRGVGALLTGMSSGVGATEADQGGPASDEDRDYSLSNAHRRGVGSLFATLGDKNSTTEILRNNSLTKTSQSALTNNNQATPTGVISGPVVTVENEFSTRGTKTNLEPLKNPRQFGAAASTTTKPNSGPGLGTKAPVVLGSGPVTNSKQNTPQGTKPSAVVTEPKKGTKANAEPLKNPRPFGAAASAAVTTSAGSGFATQTPVVLGSGPVTHPFMPGYNRAEAGATAKQLPAGGKPSNSGNSKKSNPGTKANMEPLVNPRQFGAASATARKGMVIMDDHAIGDESAQPKITVQSDFLSQDRNTKNLSSSEQGKTTGIGTLYAGTADPKPSGNAVSGEAKATGEIENISDTSETIGANEDGAAKSQSTLEDGEPTSASGNPAIRKGLGSRGVGALLSQMSSGGETDAGAPTAGQDVEKPKGGSSSGPISFPLLPGKKGIGGRGGILPSVGSQLNRPGWLSSGRGRGTSLENEKTGGEIDEDGDVEIGGGNANGVETTQAHLERGRGGFRGRGVRGRGGPAPVGLFKTILGVDTSKDSLLNMDFGDSTGNSSIVVRGRGRGTRIGGLLGRAPGATDIAFGVMDNLNKVDTLGSGRGGNLMMNKPNDDWVQAQGKGGRMGGLLPPPRSSGLDDSFDGGTGKTAGQMPFGIGITGGGPMSSDLTFRSNDGGPTGNGSSQLPMNIQDLMSRIRQDVKRIDWSADENRPGVDNSGAPSNAGRIGFQSTIRQPSSVAAADESSCRAFKYDQMYVDPFKRPHNPPEPIPVTAGVSPTKEPVTLTRNQGLAKLLAAALVDKPQLSREVGKTRSVDVVCALTEALAKYQKNKGVKAGTSSNSEMDISSRLQLLASKARGSTPSSLTEGIDCNISSNPAMPGAPEEPCEVPSSLGPSATKVPKLGFSSGEARVSSSVSNRGEINIASEIDRGSRAGSRLGFMSHRSGASSGTLDISRDASTNSSPFGMGPGGFCGSRSGRGGLLGAPPDRSIMGGSLGLSSGIASNFSGSREERGGLLDRPRSPLTRPVFPVFSGKPRHSEFEKRDFVETAEQTIKKNSANTEGEVESFW